jgi:D-alanyl-D-alanine dipeptidase
MQMFSNSQWSIFLEKYKNDMRPDVYELLHEQYTRFALDDTPSIADARIVNIPIEECGEALINLTEINNTRIQVMNNHDVILAHTYPHDIDPRSLKHSFVRKSIYEALMNMIDQLDIWSPHFAYEVGDLSIKLFEGLRDLKTQQILFDAKFNGIQQSHPTWSHLEVYQETCKWVSPYKNNVPTHSTGAAIDIHLWSHKKHNFCTMGRFNVGGETAPTFSEHSSLTTEQITNRFLFLVAATHAGLINYSYEFWHYSYGDRYATYWNKTASARYYAL